MTKTIERSRKKDYYSGNTYPFVSNGNQGHQREESHLHLSVRRSFPYQPLQNKRHITVFTRYIILVATPRSRELRSTFPAKIGSPVLSHQKAPDFTRQNSSHFWSVERTRYPEESFFAFIIKNWVYSRHGITATSRKVTIHEQLTILSAL